MNLEEELRQDADSAWMFCDVIENVHLVEIADAKDPMRAFMSRLGIDFGFFEDGHWEILGHTNTGVTVKVWYDLFDPA